VAKLRLEIEYDADVIYNDDCVADKEWFFISTSFEAGTSR
jgi:hypothetical protein